MTENELLVKVRSVVAERIALGHNDPEAGHGDIDYLCELVVQETAAGNAASQEAASIVADLLNTEKNESWTRWYA